MSTTTKISDYSQAADQPSPRPAHGRPATYAAQDPELANALAAIDLTEFNGALDSTSIEVGLSEARGEFERNQALAEVERRRLEAGAAPDTRCTCSHSGPVHARRLVDGRLRCGVTGCRCEDLAFNC